MPEEGDFFFEMFCAGGHAPRPLWIGVTDGSRLYRSDEVAIQQVLVFGIAELGIKELFEGYVVDFSYVFV